MWTVLMFTQWVMYLCCCFSRVRLCYPIDGSPPGSSVHGVFQARVLEWGAIAFSDVFMKQSQISTKVMANV